MFTCTWCLCVFDCEHRHDYLPGNHQPADRLVVVLLDMAVEVCFRPPRRRGAHISLDFGSTARTPLRRKLKIICVILIIM